MFALRCRNQELETEVLQLKEIVKLRDEQLQLAIPTTVTVPDYESARSSALNSLKVGRQSMAGKAIDVFIKELKFDFSRRM